MNCIRCKKEIPDSPYCPWCGRKQIRETRKRRTQGSGNISKLSGNRRKPYLARLNGVAIGTFETVRDAERALSRLCDVPLSDKYNFTFEKVYEAWKPEHEAVLKAKQKGTGSSSMEGYACAYKHCEELYKRQFRSIRKGELQKILNDMIDSGLSRSSAEKVKLLFSQLYQWAIADHIVMVNLADSLIIRTQKKKTPEIFTSEEIKTMTKSNTPAAQIALILIATGCRIGELFSARTEDCTEDYFVSGSKTRAGVNRVIPIAKVGITQYRSLLAKARETGSVLLIGGYEGNKNPSNYRNRDYYPMLEELGIPKKNPHCTRHTFASAAVSSNVRPEDLKEMLGHASYTTTIDVYTHHDADALVAAAQTIDL